MQYFPTPNRTALTVLTLAIAAALTLTACDKKKPASDSSSQSTTSQPDPSASPEVTAMAALCRLCRFVDSTNKGKAGTVQLTYANGTVTDSAGHNAKLLTPDEWKSVADMTRKTPDQQTAGRALPAASMDYKDGLGKIRRNAYLIKWISDDKLDFTMVKPLDDDSAG